MGAVKKTENTESRGAKITGFLRGVWGELKKVYWPGRRQVVVYTGVVLIAVAFVSILLWLVDSGLSALLSRIY